MHEDRALPLQYTSVEIKL